MKGIIFGIAIIAVIVYTIWALRRQTSNAEKNRDRKNSSLHENERGTEKLGDNSRLFEADKEK